jgi:transposase
MYIGSMSRIAPILTLSSAEKATLTKWLRSSKTEARLQFRAKLILLAEQGNDNRSVAAHLHTQPATVGKWRKRFAEDGLSGLSDAPRPGQPVKYGQRAVQRVLAKLDESPPAGYTVWSGPLLAETLGDISVDQVWRILRQNRISLSRRHSWCVSTDPDFAAKAAAIVGLYLDPPENAVVLCVDEKPAIQALERAQGWLKLPNGKALTGFSHEYKRHGTTNLFAALETATGMVHTGQYQRRRRIEFLDFMNDVVAVYPEQEIHVILDNLSTHKPKHDRWLQRHRNVHFHFTPTHASWLNQIEVWFSMLWKQALRNGNFASLKQLCQAIERFVRAYNPKAYPFQWTATNVFQRTLNNNYTNLCK